MRDAIEEIQARRGRRWALATGVAAILAVGCSPSGDDNGGGPGDGRDYAADPGGGDHYDPGTPPDTPRYDIPVDDCAEGARWIYLVDSDTTLIKFEPDVLRFTDIGLLTCPVTGVNSPFSMSVDRAAFAWVLYTGGALGLGAGNLFRVPTSDPAACAATEFVPGQEDFNLFGMGFVSNSAGSSDETLFVAGGPTAGIGTGDQRLGWIDMATLVLTPIGPVEGSPELTGTGAGQLWGFAPDTDPKKVFEIDKTSGERLRTYDLPDLGAAQPEAWAFAHWGGDYYIFLKTVDDASTNVWKLESDDGSTTNVMPDTGRRIVGAGVSTCAPILI
jgi:hypothetical protein